MWTEAQWHEAHHGSGVKPDVAMTQVEKTREALADREEQLKLLTGGIGQPPYPPLGKRLAYGCDGWILIDR